MIPDDDIPALKQKILDADVILLSYPLYFFGMPGTVKVMTDRLLSMLCTYRGRSRSRASPFTESVTICRESVFCWFPPAVMHRPT